MNKNNYVAIMAGGIGSRFWPKSRVKYPKQFLDILGKGRTLLQMTYDRFLKICPPENIFIVTNQDYVSIVKKQLPELNEEQIMGEPSRKNTAPCVAYACSKIQALNPKANIVVAPSDHIVSNTHVFSDVILNALKFSEKNDALITLGIIPTRPDTGYGYIQFEEEKKNGEVFKVKTFTEKPTLDIAKKFVKSGEFLWNSGIFIWTAESILNAFRKLQPDISEVFQQGSEIYNTKKEKAFIKKAYELCSSISIDYAIMEKSDNVYTIPSDFGWSDLGTWQSLHEKYDKDYLGNAVSGNNVMVFDASQCMIMAPENKLVVLQGLEGYCVIDTGDALLICQREKEQEIKQMTAEIKRLKGDEFL